MRLNKVVTDMMSAEQSTRKLLAERIRIIHCGLVMIYTSMGRHLQFVKRTTFSFEM